MKPNPYPSYEDATREYLTKCRALMQQPQELNTTEARSALEFPAEILIRHAEDIADISSSMIRLAQNYLDSENPMVREGIRGHFVDQATVELLLGTGLLQIGKDDTGMQSTAAARATHGAALREAISAADKSSSAPVAQGLPTAESYRSTESATIEEAASELRLAVASTASSIARRVQELGRDIAFDLVAGSNWPEVTQGTSLSGSEIAGLLESIPKNAGTPFVRAATSAAGILLNVCEKTIALLDKDVETAARRTIGEWLVPIKKADKIELFDAMIENLFGVERLKKSVKIGIDPSSAAVVSINKAADLLKAFSDKFIVLIGRMRKLEDAIRLGKLVRVPQLPAAITVLQVVLLAALVYAGHDYINKGLAGILRERGLLEP